MATLPPDSAFVFDVRHVLPAVRVPTLVLHRTGDLDAHIEEGRWISRQISGARFVELPGADHLPWVGDTDTLLDEVEEFLRGATRWIGAGELLKRFCRWVHLCPWDQSPIDETGATTVVWFWETRIGTRSRFHSVPRCT